MPDMGNSLGLIFGIQPDLKSFLNIVCSFHAQQAFLENNSLLSWYFLFLDTFIISAVQF